jgi:ribosomal protein S1
MAERFQSGQRIRCKVVKVDLKNNFLDLSIKKDTEIVPGAFVLGRVLGVKEESVSVQIGSRVNAIAYFTDLDNNFPKNPKKVYEANQFVKGKVLDTKKGVTLTLRPSVVFPGIFWGVWI